MSTVTEPARVPNACLQQAQQSALPPRRVRFARMLALAACFLLAVVPMHAQKRREAILRLREHVSTAMSHASLTEKQNQKLEQCRQTLLLSAQSGRTRKLTTRKDLDTAIREIERVFHNGPFQPADRDLVRQDVDQLRAIERNQRARRSAAGRSYLSQRL